MARLESLASRLDRDTPRERLPGIFCYAFYRNYRLGWGGLAAFTAIFLVLTCVLIVLPIMALVGAASILAFFTG